MSDPNILAFFDGRGTLTFVAGEDRTIAVLLHDATTQNPIDLTGYTVQLTLPREGGGTVKRSSGPVAIPETAVTVGKTAIYLPDHGLVTGDPVQFAGELPTPLVEATTYIVKVVDLKSFSVTMPDGTPITLSAAAGPFTMTNSVDLVPGNPVLGQTMWKIRHEVSAAVNIGLAQTFYLGFSGDGSQRWAVLTGRLDVYPPAVISDLL